MDSIKNPGSENNRRTRRSTALRGRKTSTDRTRHHLAIIVVALGFAVGFGVFLNPIADALFDKILPLVTLVLGYYFGSRRE